MVATILQDKGLDLTRPQIISNFLKIHAVLVYFGSNLPKTIAIC